MIHRELQPQPQLLFQPSMVDNKELLLSRLLRTIPNPSKAQLIHKTMDHHLLIMTMDLMTLMTLDPMELLQNNGMTQNIDRVTSENKKLTCRNYKKRQRSLRTRSRLSLERLNQ
jgi:hypothetical protein